jgi:hypothetical protein
MRDQGQSTVEPYCLPRHALSNANAKKLSTMLIPRQYFYVSKFMPVHTLYNFGSTLKHRNLTLGLESRPGSLLGPNVHINNDKFLNTHYDCEVLEFLTSISSSLGLSSSSSSPASLSSSGPTTKLHLDGV